MRYFIDQSEMEPEICLSFYRAVLAWAAGRADRFVMTLQSGIYDNPQDEEQIRRLGTSEDIDLQAGKGPFGRGVARLFRIPSTLVRVTGRPSEEYVHELTRKGAPAKAVAGDVCPVEDLELYRAEHLLFGSYDYGRDLLLELDAVEVEVLRTTLKGSRLDVECVKVLNLPDRDPGRSTRE